MSVYISCYSLTCVDSPFTAARLLFPKDFASNVSLSPDVIASTPKASVTSNAVHFSSRAKGLSKTVSLSVCWKPFYYGPGVV